ncbi:type IV pilus modification protein PilV [Luteibacter sp. 22Crub2.1]|uniref:type IV pilus modification protein PilV n=1 Tax=Luteibacter sp. 22Crub2.1 TaxID=1283288 RepID=UPI0009A5B5CB|nr:type IV pilus modification protein PilV [Luteibacter sp. 22Crub2.1]
MASTRHVRGVSLIEVLMAVLVFTVGLLGLSSLLIASFRSNQVGYQRTQAEFIAMSMADRMRANPLGVWAGGYNFAAYPLSGSQACTADVACTPAKLALRDQYIWSSQLRTFLPNASASIACSNGTTANATQLQVRPPYAGNCVMRISWTERGAGDSKHQDAAPRVYVWNFQP